MAKIEFKRFSKNDRNGLAGATCFNDGGNPWIGNVTVDGIENDGFMVVDRNGASICFAEDFEVNFPKMTIVMAKLLFEKEMTEKRIREIEQAWNACI